jgi:hypothetical protein
LKLPQGKGKDSKSSRIWGISVFVYYQCKNTFYLLEISINQIFPIIQSEAENYG